MGTSARYNWPPAKSITKPIADAEPDSAALIEEVHKAADQLCAIMLQPAWRATVTDPIVNSAAGVTIRMCDGVGDIIEGKRQWPADDAALATFLSDVCADSDGVHDAPTRQALIATISQADMEVQARIANGQPLDSTLFCLLYQLFHVELMTALLLHFTCEAALPGVSTLTMSDELRQWATKRVARLLPNPCTEPNPRRRRIFERGGQLALRALNNLIEDRETEPAEIA